MLIAGAKNISTERFAKATRKTHIGLKRCESAFRYSEGHSGCDVSKPIGYPHVEQLQNIISLSIGFF